MLLGWALTTSPPKASSCDRVTWPRARACRSLPGRFFAIQVLRPTISGCSRRAAPNKRRRLIAIAFATGVGGGVESGSEMGIN